LQKNKINLIIIFPRFILGGASNSVFRLINFLDHKRFNINIICLKKCDYKKKFNKKVNIFELNKDKLIQVFFKILSICKNISKSSSRNIILSNHHYANVYSILIKLIVKNISILCVERTCIYELSHYYSILDFLKKTILKFLVKNLYKFSDKIVSNTKFTKKEIQNFSRENTLQIYPPTLKKIFNFKRKKFLKYFNIVWVGRLDPEKGIEEFCKLICKINFKSKIFILGGGKKKKHYENFIKKHKSPKVKVYFKGFVNNSDIYYKKSHLLINTSYFEGSNNSIIEAINNNLFVMATNSPGGNKELINKNYGLLFNLDNQKEALKKIEYIRKNYKILQSKIKSKNIFLKQFIETKSNNSYLKIINRI
jgi:glycosyltransferase involved in cell wall biosynthesis